MQAIATSFEMEQQFDKYLQMVINGTEVIVTQNGKEIGKFIPKKSYISEVADSLVGIVKGNYDYQEEKRKVLNEKYEIND